MLKNTVRDPNCFFTFLASRDKYVRGANAILTLAISFKPDVIEFSYCICVFLVTRPFTWYHNFLLDLEVRPTFEKL